MTKNQLLELFPTGYPDIPQDRLGGRRLFDPITAISGGLGLVGNVVGGIMGNSAAKKAGQIQNQADQAAADQVGVATGDANKGISGAVTDARTLALDSGGRVVDAAKAGAEGATTAATSANSLLDPYAQAGAAATGTLQTGLAPGGDFNKTPTLSDLQMDPGYAFRTQQGQMALDRTAAARGGSQSGAAIKDTVNYEQGAASQEYANAFNRFQTSTQNRFSNLDTMSKQGQVAATQQGGNTINAAQYGGTLTTDAAKSDLQANEFAGSEGLQGATDEGRNLINGATTSGNFRTSGAAAQAAGIVGGSNALWNGVNGGINSAGEAAANYKANGGTWGSSWGNLLKNPAAKGNGQGADLGG